MCAPTHIYTYAIHTSLYRWSFTKAHLIASEFDPNKPDRIAPSQPEATAKSPAKCRLALHLPTFWICLALFFRSCHLLARNRWPQYPKGYKSLCFARVDRCSTSAFFGAGGSRFQTRAVMWRFIYVWSQVGFRFSPLNHNWFFQYRLAYGPTVVHHTHMCSQVNQICIIPDQHNSELIYNVFCCIDFVFFFLLCVIF